MNLRILTLTLGAFAVGTESFVIGGILPRIAGEFDVAIAAAGQLVSVFAFAYAVGSPLFTTLTVKLPRRLLLVAAIGLFGLVNLGAALAPAFGWLMAARIVAGCVAGVYIPTAVATAASVVPAVQRGRALALVTVASSLATVVGVPLGIWIAARSGWRGTFVFVAALSEVAALGIAVLLPATPPDTVVPLGKRLRVLARGDVLASLAVTTLWMMGGFTIYTYIAPLMKALNGATDATLSGLILAFGVAGTLGSWVGGSAVDRMGAGWVLVPSLGILATNSLLLPETGSTVIGAAVFISIWGVAGWAFSPAQQHRLIALVPATPTVVLSLNASAIYLGIALGAVAGAASLEITGNFRHLGVVACAFEVVALGVVLYQLARQSRAGEATSTETAGPDPRQVAVGCGCAARRGRADGRARAASAGAMAARRSEGAGP